MQNKNLGKLYQFQARKMKLPISWRTQALSKTEINPNHNYVINNYVRVEKAKIMHIKTMLQLLAKNTSECV